MAGQTLGEVLRRIGRRAGLEGVLTLSDAELLERFAAGRDEPAFAALVVRHGPMVLGVCRRLLNDAGQAEDAFQAAFLVLARKANAVRRRPLLGAWLYGVAYKVAARLRGRIWRRYAREKPADFDALPSSAVPDSSDYPAIHDEVRRLPDRYRAPVVLCYLEGKTHEEAARELRWPIGSVKGRLARARDLLRSRLGRRGLGPCEDDWTAAPAAVPPMLVDTTVRAAPLFAAGDATAGGLASARALALSQGVLRTMMLTNGKIAAALLLTAALLGGVGNLVYQTAVADPAPAPKAVARGDKPPALDKPKDDKDAIQGTWQVTAVEAGGKDVSGTDEFKDSLSGMWTFGTDKIVIHWKGKPEETAAYNLDQSKAPKELDVTDNEKGKTTPAIYSLEGDVLKVCAGSPGVQARPTELVSKEGAKTLLITLKRVEAGKDKPKDDKEAIRGAWRVLALETDGKEQDDREARKVKAQTWVFGADKLVMKIPGPVAAADQEAECSYTLDLTQSPAALDVTPTSPNQGATVKAVYSLEGDTLKICHSEGAGAVRPKEVVAKEGSHTTLLTLKREGK